MRIVAGEAKNRKIKSQNTHNVRPTMERVKESLFSIITSYIEGAVFLDLYSGTGNIALEAISRGAKRAVMIEGNPEALKIIIENVNNMKFQDRCRAYRNDVMRAIEILGNKRESFDIIFMDPPYKENLCGATINKILENGLLKKTGILIAEHFIKEDMPEEIGELKKTDERKYGNKVITFYGF